MKFVFRPEYKILPRECDSQFHVVTSFSVPAESGDDAAVSPLTLALVIDNSGSMSGYPLEQTRKAMLELLPIITRHDRLMIVTFESEVRTVYQLDFAQNKNDIAALINNIRAMGSTNLSGGWLQALTQIEDSFDQTHINRVFLLTDGQANAGICDPEQLIKIGQTYREKGIPTSTFGFGNGFNESLLKNIAEKSGGGFYYIQKPEDISTAFSSEFGEVRALVGQNGEITFELPDGVEFIEDLSGFAFEKKQNQLKYNIGDIANEIENEIIFRVKTRATFAKGTPVLLKIKGKYTQAGGEFSLVKSEQQLKIKFAEKTSGIKPDEEVVDSVILARCMKAKTFAYEEAMAGRIEEAIKIIQARETVILERLEASMVADRDRLDLELKQLEKVKLAIKGPTAESGKTIKSQIEEYTRKRGAYIGNRREKKHVLQASVLASKVNRQIKLKNDLRVALNDLGLESEFLNRCMVSFTELLSNAVEHGCGRTIGAEVNIEGIFRKGSAWIKITNPGQGFNYETKLGEAQAMLQAKTAEQILKNRTAERGRGLAVLLSYTDSIKFNDKGTEVLVKLSNKVTEGVISFDNSTVGSSGSSPMNSSSLELKNHQVGSNLIVEVIINGGMDCFTVPALRNVLNDTSSKGIRNMIFNLKNVSYIDSSGLGYMVFLKKAAREMGGESIFCALNEPLYNVIRSCKLDDFFQIFDDLNQALQYFNT